MTAQSHDTLALDAHEYEITGASKEPLFVPNTFGITPVASSTACWRGHMCHYIVDPQGLALQTLWTNHNLDTMPTLNEVKANESNAERYGHRFQGQYSDLDLRLDYTGDLLISRQQVSHEIRLHGFTWPWHFDTTFKLSFVLGRLVDRLDVSNALKVFESRYCIDGYLYGDGRRNGLRFLRRHIGYGFRF
jgi:hypothetical protein